MNNILHPKSLASHLLTHKKLIINIVAISATAVVGTAGVLAAPHFNSNDPKSGTPGIVAFCKREYKQLGFKNVGQCVSTLVHGGGEGYGGNGQGDDNDHGDGNNDQHGQGNNHHKNGGDQDQDGQGDHNDNKSD